MKKLIIYGDSYGQKHHNPSISWITQLADKLNLSMINRAMPGSSIEYSIKYFIKDKLLNNITQDDIIIFIFTSFGRQHLRYQLTFPETASGFSYGNFDIDYPSKHAIYYNTNKNYIRWYEDQKDKNIFKINASSYIHMLNTYARDNPGITFMILSMDTLSHPIDIPNLDNFLISNISLRTLSSNEFSSNISFSSFTEKIISEPRYTHLTNPNIAILADLAYKALINKDASFITYDKFFKNILDRNILSKKDYLYFIEKGILSIKSNLMDRLS